MLGFMVWIGGAIAISLAASATTETPQATRGNLHRASMAVVAPGILAAWVGGLGMLLPHFSEVYARAGWMHTKLTLLILLSGLTGALSAKLRKSANGSSDVSAATFRKIGVVMFLLASVVISLAVIRPGS